LVRLYKSVISSLFLLLVLLILQNVEQRLAIVEYNIYLFSLHFQHKISHSQTYRYHQIDEMLLLRCYSV